VRARARIDYEHANRFVSRKCEDLSFSLDHTKKISTIAERFDRFLALKHQNHVSGDSVIIPIKRVEVGSAVTVGVAFGGSAGALPQAINTIATKAKTWTKSERRYI
jgi:hypothetical protein